MIKQTIILTFFIMPVGFAQTLPNCDKVNEDEKRLLCYDTWMAQARRAEEREDVVENQNQQSSNQTVISSMADNVGVLLPKARITLADGSVWQLDETRTVYVQADNPRVTIEVSRFGGHRMTIEGVNRKLRVWRIEE